MDTKLSLRGHFGGSSRDDGQQCTDKGTFFLSKGAASEILRKVEERKLPKPLEQGGECLAQWSAN